MALKNIRLVIEGNVLERDLGPDAFFGENLKQERVGDSAVDDMNLGAACPSMF